MMMIMMIRPQYCIHFSVWQIRQRITGYFVACHCYRCLLAKLNFLTWSFSVSKNFKYSIAPAYLTDALQPVTDVPERRRLLYIHRQHRRLLYHGHVCTPSAIQHWPLQRQECGIVCRRKWRRHERCCHLKLISIENLCVLLVISWPADTLLFWLWSDCSLQCFYTIHLKLCACM